MLSIISDNCDAQIYDGDRYNGGSQVNQKRLMDKKY